MKKVLYLCFLSLLGCGNQDSYPTNYITIKASPTPYPSPYPSPDCSIAAIDNGVAITCNGITQNVYNGSAGPQGAQGAAGEQGVAGPSGTNGVGLVYSLIAASSSQCSSGGYILSIGQDTNANGVLDTSDSNISSATICNGTQSNFTPSYSIAPCGVGSSAIKELLLCLYDGSLLTSYSDTSSGKNTRLAIIPPGTYQTTDGSGCSFKVVNDSMGNTVSWSAGSKWSAGSITCKSN